MKRAIAFSFLFLTSFFTFSQQKDFGAWSSAAFVFKPNKKIDLGVAPEFRWDQNLGRLRTRLIDFKGKYDITKELTGILVYRFAAIQRNSGWQPRRRLQIGLSYTYDYNEFDFSIATKVQRGKSLETATRDADLNNNWRNKFSVTYKGLKKIDIAMSYEFFHSIMETNRFEWTDWRWILDAEYKLTKEQSIGLGYLIQNEFQFGVDNRDRVLLLHYKYVLKK
jgi:hypothetical protein